MSERERRAAERAAKQRHQELRQAETDRLNDNLKARLESLNSILDSALKHTVAVEQIVVVVVDPPTIPTPLSRPQPPEKEKYQAKMPPPTFAERHLGIGQKKRQAMMDEIRERYQQAVEGYKLAMQQYQANEEARRKAISMQQKMVADFRIKLSSGDVHAVTSYFQAVLEHSIYPDGFGKRKVKLGFNPETGELVVEYDLPTYEAIIPTVKAYKYVKTRDVIEEQLLNKTDERQMKELYEEIIAAIALRTLHELFSTDFVSILKLVVFNGMVNTVDKATGRNVRPCLVSVQVTREDFRKLELKRVDKRACLKHLKAQTSPSSKEMVAVKPLVELMTTDPRFVEEIDVLTSLDSRPNLLEMSPPDFEQLIGNLFTEMGFKTGTTRISRDGGVDVIAFDERPIVGGKIIIQAKRYRNTVGIESVRALYGTMQDEGATKGILVCTSSFGVASREFVKDKPIELIDGNGLLHYLQEQGHAAKIEIPGA
jgi:restriction system protein